MISVGKCYFQIKGSNYCVSSLLVERLNFLVDWKELLKPPVRSGHYY